MHYFFRLTATLTGALVLSGQVGCALTPEAARVEARSVTTVSSAALVTNAAETYSHPVSSSAYPTNFVELHDAQPGAMDDDFVRGYSNTFISETKDGQPAGLFVAADYYDWGGYPVYYPYPYTLVSQPCGYQWSGAYGNWSRYYDSYSGYRSGATAVGAPAHSGSGPVSSKGQDVTGGVAQSSGGTLGPYTAAQTRGRQGGGASYSRGYAGSGKSSGQSYRGRQRGMGGSHGVSRGRTGSTWRSQPR